MKKSKRLFPAQLSLWLKLQDFQMLAFFIAGLVFGGARQSKMITAVEYNKLPRQFNNLLLEMIEINSQSLLILLICIGVVVVIILLYQLFAHDKDERKNKLRAFKASHRPEAWHSRKRGKRNKDLEELQGEVRAKGLIRRAGDL